MVRSLNRATLIGNLTRDPELRYTPAGTAVCTFSVATNRSWKTDSGDTKEDVEFHRIVAWDKLAEICSQMLTKGKKVFVEGRIQSRKWTGQDGQQKTTTEIVITDMMVLDKLGSETPSTGASAVSQEEDEISVPEDFGETAEAAAPKAPAKASAPEKQEAPDDIPF
jgi:single-strand DNA-binding protein